MSHEIITIKTINTDIINVATTEVVTIQGVGLQGDSGDNVGVASFNGRVGIVFPELDDYQASLITNDSTEEGATVKDSLDALDIEQQEQDDAIQANTDAINNLPSTFVESFNGRTGAVSPALDDYQTSLITNDSTQTGATSKDAFDNLRTEQDTQNTDITTNADNITAIEDTAVFESPISPHPINYIWLGSQIDYDAIISYDDSTIYNVNNNLETKALWFRTQNVSPITPTITGTVGDWKAENSDEGTALGTSAPTFTYSDSSVENLVTMTNFDPLDVTQVLFMNEGLMSISNISVFTQLSVLQLSNNQLTDIGDTSNLTQLTFLSLASNQLTDIGDISTLTQLTILYLQDNQLTDIGDMSTMTQLTILSLPRNQLTDIGDISALTQLTYLHLASNQLTDIGDISTLTQLTYLDLASNQLTDIGGIGSANLNTLQLQNNALTQTCVDQVIIDVDTLGASNGTLNLSGGTNSAPSGASSTALANLITKGWTVTTN